MRINFCMFAKIKCMQDELNEPNYNISEDIIAETSVSFNKNESQTEFNQIKGTILEFGEGEKHCWVILVSGRQRKRHIYISIKKDCYFAITNKFCVEDKVNVKFYVASFEGTKPPINQIVKKWYTVCSLIQMEMLP